MPNLVRCDLHLGILHNEPDLGCLPAQIERFDRLAIEDDSSAHLAVSAQSGLHSAKQRGFSAARRPRDQHEFTFVDSEVNI